MAQKIKVALLQLLKVKSKEQNVKYALEKIREVVKKYNVKLVVLPECFAGPYETQLFAEYSEQIPGGPTCLQLSKIAKELNIYVVGTLFEKDGSKIYNTATVWDPSGTLIGKHRKVHLFDITMDEVKYRESDALTPGSNVTIVNIEGRKVGICVCYDMRFAEFARVYRNEGCEMLIYPAAFDPVQGNLHWELLMRGRALDNQLFVAGISSARDVNEDYTLWGHSMLVDPNGIILGEASEKEEFVIAELDFNLVAKARQQIPLQQQRRTDIYDTLKKK